MDVQRTVAIYQLPAWFGSELEADLGIRLEVREGQKLEVTGLVLYGDLSPERTRYALARAVRFVPDLVPLGGGHGWISNSPVVGYWPRAEAPSAAELGEARAHPESFDRSVTDRRLPDNGTGSIVDIGIPDEQWRQILTRRPDDTPDKWAQVVAEAYRELYRRTGKPTTEIARLADVPKTTVNRWVRDARSRGYLAATTRGKARS